MNGIHFIAVLSILYWVLMAPLMGCADGSEKGEPKSSLEKKAESLCQKNDGELKNSVIYVCIQNSADYGCRGMVQYDCHTKRFPRGGVK